LTPAPANCATLGQIAVLKGAAGAAERRGFENLGEVSGWRAQGLATFPFTRRAVSRGLDVHQISIALDRKWDQECSGWAGTVNWKTTPRARSRSPTIVRRELLSGYSDSALF
jgi:hypothetical protein